MTAEAERAWRRALASATAAGHRAILAAPWYLNLGRRGHADWEEMCVSFIVLTGERQEGNKSGKKRLTFSPLSTSICPTNIFEQVRRRPDGGDEGREELEGRRSRRERERDGGGGRGRAEKEEPASLRRRRRNGTASLLLSFLGPPTAG